MKTGNYDWQQKTIDAYQEFTSLWHLTDPDWITQRKAAWKLGPYGTDGDPNSLFNARFFVYGEEPPGYIGENQGDCIKVDFGFSQRIAFTPFENAAQIKRFWDITIQLKGGHAQQCHSAALSVGGWAANMPHREELVRLITETLFAPEYFMNKLGGTGAYKDELITDSPGDFVRDYASLSSFYHKSNNHKWDYRNFSFDYFMLSVKHCVEKKTFEKRHFANCLPQMYEYLLEQDDAGLNQYRLALKQQLIAAADTDQYLHKALEQAREELEE